MNTYNYEDVDLLTYDDLKKVMREKMPAVIANLIYPKLKKYVCYSNKHYFELQTNYTYIQDMNDDFLILKVSYLLTQSYNNLSSDNKDELNEQYSKQLMSMAQISTISRYSPFIEQLFKNSRVKMNTYINQIHFNNGYIDIEDKQFKQRIIGVHFISEYIK